MKTFKTMVMTICAFKALTGQGDNVSQTRMEDILKPDIQVKEQAVRRFIESFDNADIQYDIQTFRYRAALNKKRNWLEEFDGHDVTLPEDIQKQVDALDKQILHDTFLDYFDDKRYSFTVAVLMMAEVRDFRSPVFGFNLPWKPQAFLMADKILWQNNLKSERGEFLNSYDYSLRMDGLSRFLRLTKEQVMEDRERSKYQELITSRTEEINIKVSYKFFVLLESIPVAYTNIIMDISSCPVFAEYSKKNKSLKEFFYTKYPTFNYPSLDILIYIAPCEKWHEIRNEDTQKFLGICRKNDPAKKPYLSALMMALFTVDGYYFNDETGVYTMNERGRMLMDFIVEFPIPENATRLQAVMNGGNKDEIEAMMKKHGTEEKWRELLKNPVHPEFSKYPQE